MARNDLMGLAALGALGLMMSGKKSPGGDSSDAVAASYPGLMEQQEPGWQSATGPTAAPAASRRTVAAADTSGPMLDASRADLEAGMTRGQRPADPRDLEKSMTRGQRPADPRDLEKGMTRGQRAAPSFISPEEAARRYVPRRQVVQSPISSAQALANLDAATGVRPMDPNSPRGPNAADSTELGRNLSAAANALGPAGLAGAGAQGLRVAREFGANSPVQRAYNAAAAARRAAEGYSPAEAQAAREAAELAVREGKTLNPNAWLAGPRGMAENFKKGGKVTKKVVSKPQRSSASSRADGIAQRGKTRGVMR